MVIHYYLMAEYVIEVRGGERIQSVAEPLLSIVATTIVCNYCSANQFIFYGIILKTFWGEIDDGCRVEFGASGKHGHCANAYCY